MMEEEINLEAPVTGEMIALLTVLSLFTVVGTVGNGLVLFVFSRVRDKTTAQLFILALAMIDLFTCMMIIPMTMYVEYTRYDIKFDWLCKLYQFLITSKVPLSAFIMVAIAFDRYFCICHPLRKIITPWRTKVTLVSLTLFAATLGMMTSLAYGVNQVFSPYDLGIYNSILNSSVIPAPPDTIKDWTKLGEDPSIKNDITMSVELRLKLYMFKRNTSSLSVKRGVQETVYIGICAPNEILLDWDFVSVYQKCYTVLFLICLVIVGVLYGMIYRFIGVRRNKKLQQRLVLCAYVNSTHGYRDTGTRITFVNSNIHDNHNDDDKFETSSQGLGPGGIYIGDCPTPPLHPHSEHTNVRKAGSSLNVSFAEPESGKPAPEGSDEKSHGVEEVVVAASVIGNSHNMEVSVTSEVEQGNDPKRTQSEEPEPRKHSGTSLQSAEDTDSKTSDIRKSSEAIHHNASHENATDNNRKQPAHKSPSLGSSARTRRKRLWKSSRRPKSFAEDPGSKDGGAPTHRFCKRRASSPFKREMGGASTKQAPWVEMRNLPCRRDSEPFRNVAADAFPDLYSQISRRKGEDFLTMGSRKHYDANYLETSIEEDCSTSVPSRYTPLSSDTTGNMMFRRDFLDNPAVPVIQVINSEVVPDPEVLQHPTGDLSDSDTAEAQTPLLHGAREDYPNEKKELHTNKSHSFKDAAPLSLSTPPYPCDVKVSSTIPHVEFMDSTQPHKHETDLDKPFITIDDPEIRIAEDILSNPFIRTDTPDIHIDISASKTQPSCTEAPEIRVVPTSPPSAMDAPEIRVFESLWNNQVPQSGAQQPALLTTYVRNISPSSGGSCHVSPRPSCSDVSHHWTMEESSVGGFPGLDPGHLLIPSTSRRSTMESRSSTMDGSVPRPRTARKKRWQHFRSKNASIKGNQGRHYRATSAAASASFTGNSESVFYGRRSVVSYDADRLRDETRAANARTALMLFTVTLVFVVAFLPAWLMAHRVVPTQLMVFYLYFTYNVANPFIYAFMNAIFKEQLRKIFRCWRKGDLC